DGPARAGPAGRAGEGPVDPAAAAAQALGDQAIGAVAQGDDVAGLGEADGPAVADVVVAEAQGRRAEVAEDGAAAAADRLQEHRVGAGALGDDIPVVVNGQRPAGARGAVRAAEGGVQIRHARQAHLAAAGPDRLDDQAERTVALGVQAAAEAGRDRAAVEARAAVGAQHGGDRGAAGGRQRRRLGARGERRRRGGRAALVMHQHRGRTAAAADALQDRRGRQVAQGDDPPGVGAGDVAAGLVLAVLAAQVEVDRAQQAAVRHGDVDHRPAAAAADRLDQAAGGVDAFGDDRAAVGRVDVAAVVVLAVDAAQVDVDVEGNGGLVQL